MPGYEDTEAGFEAGLDSFEELTGPERERSPGELHAELIHRMRLADRPRPRRRADLPDTGSLRDQLGV